MKKVLLKISILLLLLTVLSCKIEEVAAPKLEYEPEIVVFAMLLATERPNDDQKTVRIERTYVVTDTLPYNENQRAVKDAKVFIETEGQRVQFHYTFASNYEDIADQLKIVAGQTYKLDITLSDGRKITSQCLMPGRPHIISPTTDVSVEAYKPLPVKWTEDEFAHRYEVSIEEEFNAFLYDEFFATTEEEIFFFILAPPGKYYIKVASLDQNYYDYLRSRQNRQPISNINGALGVFGAMAYSKAKFFATLP